MHIVVIEYFRAQSARESQSRLLENRVRFSLVLQLCFSFGWPWGNDGSNNDDSPTT